MQIPQRSVVPCSGLTSWVYGANHAGITAVNGGRRPQGAVSAPWLLYTSSTCFHQCGNRWQTLLLLRLLTEEPLAINFSSQQFLLVELSSSPWQKMDFWIKLPSILPPLNTRFQEITVLLKQFGMEFLRKQPSEIHFLPRPWVIPFHLNCHVCSNWRLLINNVMLTNLALLSLRAFSVTLFSVPSSSSFSTSPSSKLLFNNPYLVPTCCLSVLTQAVFELGIFSW